MWIVWDSVIIFQIFDMSIWLIVIHIGCKFVEEWSLFVQLHFFVFCTIKYKTVSSPSLFALHLYECCITFFLSNLFKEWLINWLNLSNENKKKALTTLFRLQALRMWYVSTEFALLLIKKTPNTLKYQMSLLSMTNISSTCNNETDPQYIYLCTQSTWHFNFSFNSKQTILTILYPKEKQWNSCTS